MTYLYNKLQSTGVLDNENVEKYTNVISHVSCIIDIVACRCIGSER